MTAVRQIERFVDQRKVGNDIADDRVLEQRPVLPRRIMRVAAADRSVRAGFQRDYDRDAPAFDRAERKAGRRSDRR